MDSGGAESSLDRARAACGGNAGLSRALTQAGRAITSQAISQWRRVPAERVIEVERVSGISRERLRPDLYPATSPASSDAAA